MSNTLRLIAPVPVGEGVLGNYHSTQNRRKGTGTGYWVAIQVEAIALFIGSLLFVG